MTYIRTTLHSIIALASILFVTLFSVQAAHAATMSFDPSTGSTITGCNTIVDIMIDTEGSSTNGTQFYLDHDGLVGEVTLLSNGDFSTYTVPALNPTPYDLLVGFGNYLSAADVQFGQVRLNSTRIGDTITLTPYYLPSDPISTKVALDGADITTSVNGASFTVVDGFCETVPPYLNNLDPVPNEPAQPVADDIIFDVQDNSSGVDIVTLVVDVTQNGATITYLYDDANLTYMALNTRDFGIVINPTDDFVAEVLVTVRVRAADKAGNSMDRTYTFNDLTCAELGCSGAILITQCNDGVDNDGDGGIDLGDTGCTDITDNNEYTSPGSHQCNDGIDNDGDGSIDTADSNCTQEDDGSVTEVVTTTETDTYSIEVNIPDCRDGIDNDGDTLVDFPADAGCESADDEDEYLQSPDDNFSVDDLLYFLADRTIQTYTDGTRTVEGLAGNPLGVDLVIDTSGTSLSSVELQTSFGTYDMVFDNTTGHYRTDLILPSTIGLTDAFVRVTYADTSIETLPFRLNVLPFGIVYTTGGNTDTPIDAATVTLESYEAGEYTVVSRELTNTSGVYAFVVPNGVYRLAVEADDHRNHTTPRFLVGNSIVSKQVSLIPTVSLLDPDVSVEEKVDTLIATVRDQAVYVQNVFNDPIFEEATEQSVAPIAAVATAAALIPALSALGFLNYLRFLFLQPILLLGRKKRKGWGYVYNALTRTPLDLTLVRLIDNDTGRVVQTRVTDAEGRYVFFVDPGLYRLEVSKEGFIFPTAILAGEQEDGQYLDIYHGEPIRVSAEGAAITANIPIDPPEANKKPHRLGVAKFFRLLQGVLAIIGVFAGIVSIIVSPSIWTVSLLFIQVLIVWLFYRIAKPKRPKHWGIVYNGKDNKSIGNVIVRLFSKKFDKLVSTEFTDTKGRYAFLANPNDYYVTFEKQGFKNMQKDVSVSKDSELIIENIKLDPEVK